jgi:hypothetical protein
MVDGLQIIDPLANRICVGGWQALGFAQILLKAKDRRLVLSVLLQAATLVVDVGRVVGVEIEVSKNLDTLLEIPEQTRLLGRAFLGFPITCPRARGCQQEDNASK